MTGFDPVGLTRPASQLVTVFGGSGFVGSQAVRYLAKAGWRVRVAVRNPNLAYKMRLLGDVGQVDVVQANVRDKPSLERALTTLADQRAIEMQRRGIDEFDGQFGRRDVRERFGQSVHAGKQDLAGKQQGLFRLQHKREIEECEAADIEQRPRADLGRTRFRGFERILDLTQAIWRDQRRKFRRFGTRQHAFAGAVEPPSPSCWPPGFSGLAPLLLRP